MSGPERDEREPLGRQVRTEACLHLGGDPFRRVRRDQQLDLLHRGVAVLVHDDHAALLAAEDGERDPDRRPERERDQREDQVERVVDGLALDDDGLKVALRLDARASRNLRGQR